MSPARIFFSFLLTLVLLVLSPLPSFAQTEPKQDLHNYTQTVMIEVTSSLICMLTGIDPIKPSQKCFGINNGRVGPVDTSGGAIGSIGSILAMTFPTSASTGDYVNYMASNFGLAKPVLAQQTGFDRLSPFTKIWVGFRNIVYLIFVLVFVIIGFAIMLRVRIDPRTVMSIENQIPKIIVALVMVTFSFAIAGLLIDLMWVSIYLVINVFGNIHPPILTKDANFYGQNAIQAFGEFVGFKDTVLGSSGSIRDIVSNLLFVGQDNGNIFILSGLFNIADAIKNLGGWLIGQFAGILALLVITFAVLYSLFRLWFTLLKAYVFILLDIVFAPFWILAGLIPGSKLSFEGWLRDLGSNLLAFPATIVLFLLARVFIDIFAEPGSNTAFIPLIGNPGMPGAIGSIVGLGFILFAPGIVETMRKVLHAPEVDLSSIWKGVGFGVARTMGIAKTGQNILKLSQEQEMRNIDPTTGEVRYGKIGIGRAFFKGISPF